jgi:hypothetical protein
VLSNALIVMVLCRIINCRACCWVLYEELRREQQDIHATAPYPSWSTCRPPPLSCCPQ